MKRIKSEAPVIWEKRIERLRSSDLTFAEFAAEAGVNLHSLKQWKYRLDREARGEPWPPRIGRTPVPEDLPRVEFEVLPEEVKREGLDAFTRIGQETSEVVERRPSSMVVVRVIRPKFLRRNAATLHSEFLVGAPPSLPIVKGMAGPSLLADTIVRRWQDHLPLHRLEGVYKREGFPLARSTMCTWYQRLAETVTPVVAAMRADAFEAPYLCVDATSVLVKARDKCKRSHFWVLIAPEKHVLFEFTKQHTKEAVDGILAGYRGTLLADAHTVYDHLYDDNTLVEANCWAHARRYFYKALEADKERAERALSMVRLLFDIERHIRNASKKEREEIRDKHSPSSRAILLVVRPRVGICLRGDAHLRWDSLCAQSAQRAQALSWRW